jgi:signal transduction histidine kinase
VGAAARELGPQVSRSGCRLSLELAPGLRGRWDRLRLAQLIRILIANAIKFGRHAPVDVSTSAEGHQAVLRIRDHGVGVDVKDHQRIFEEFGRVSPVETHGGFGLGLYIARQIARAHGGSVAVRSRAGEGATFTVRLPRDAAATEAA